MQNKTEILKIELTRNEVEILSDAKDKYDRGELDDGSLTMIGEMLLQKYN